MVRSVLRVCVIAAAGVVVVPAAAGATVRNVGPGQSIQAAVDASAPGDVVVVRGLHQENVAVTTSRLTVRGDGAVLEPPAEPQLNACFDGSSPEDVNGFCVVGDPEHAPVADVTITGFTLRGFSDSGIVAFGARDATFSGNRAFDNGSYGVTAFVSTGTRFLRNRVRNNGEAGIYIGDSPDAAATARGNDVAGSLFGILIRDAEGATVTGNRLHNNCVGAVVLADAPGPAGNVGFSNNVVRENTKACPAGEDVPFPLSGAGIGLIGANDVRVEDNEIMNNPPGGPSAFSGGVVVASGGPTAPTGNVVTGNVILHNAPDLFWDGTGSGNVFTANVCQTSVPGGLCS